MHNCASVFVRPRWPGGQDGASGHSDVMDTSCSCRWENKAKRRWLSPVLGEAAWRGLAVVTVKAMATTSARKASAGGLYVQCAHRRRGGARESARTGV